MSRSQEERLRGFFEQARFVGVFSDSEWAAVTSSVVSGERSEEDVFAEFGQRVAEALWTRFEALHSSAWADPPDEPLRFAVGASVLLRAGGAWYGAAALLAAQSNRGPLSTCVGLSTRVTLAGPRLALLPTGTGRRTGRPPSWRPTSCV